MWFIFCNTELWQWFSAPLLKTMNLNGTVTYITLCYNQQSRHKQTANLPDMQTATNNTFLWFPTHLLDVKTKTWVNILIKIIQNHGMSCKVLETIRGKAKQNIKIKVFYLFQNVLVIENLLMGNMCANIFAGWAELILSPILLKVSLSCSMM